MEQESIESLEKQNASEYLKSGSQTEITEQIEGIASSIEGNFEEKIKRIFEIVSRLSYVTKNKNDFFRKRTADQIITDDFVTGCTDEALVFIVLARASKIPAKYIETIDDEWLQKPDISNINGHVYAGVFDGGKWIIVDPAEKKIDVDIKKDGQTIVGEGFDSWSIGIDSFDSLRSKFKIFLEKNNLV